MPGLFRTGSRPLRTSMAAALYSFTAVFLLKTVFAQWELSVDQRVRSLPETTLGSATTCRHKDTTCRAVSWRSSPEGCNLPSHKTSAVLSRDELATLSGHAVRYLHFLLQGFRPKNTSTAQSLGVAGLDNSGLSHQTCIRRQSRSVRPQQLHAATTGSFNTTIIILVRKESHG